MSRNYRVSHITRYRYSEQVMLCHNVARMSPLHGDGQICERSVFSVDPRPADISERQDYFGNRLVYFNVEGPHDALEVKVVSDVRTADPRVHDDFDAFRAWEEVRDWQPEDEEAVDWAQFTLASPLIPDAVPVAELCNAVFTPSRPIVEALYALTREIHDRLEYDPVATTVSTPLAVVVQRRRGVCQDFAQLAIACLRHQGLPAAYVSGYLETLPPPGQRKLIGADASHAWFSAWVPGIGWLDFDPTNNQVPDDRYVRVARGRDYSDVPPLKGVVFGGGAMRLHVAVDVTPIESYQGEG